MSVVITNIQRTSFHDGKGIRTTVFFKGCNLHCPWCANPETISSSIEFYFNAKRCIAENKKCVCNNNCPILSKETKLGNGWCPVGGIESFGTEYDEDSLYKELIKDKIYYNTHGGITFSGGEPFNQLYKIKNSLQKLKQDSINVTVETSLYVSKSFLKCVLPYIDCFYIDIKSLEADVVKKILGGNLDNYISNIETVFSEKKTVIFRMPLVPNITITKKNYSLLEEFLDKYHPEAMEYFSLHQLAKKKYELLGKEFKFFETADDDSKEAIKTICNKLSIPSKELRVGEL